MIYRIYVETKGSYEQVGNNIKKKHLIKVLDNIMETIGKNKVLVIGHNIEYNYDVPVFLNITDKYEEFRNGIISKKKSGKKVAISGKKVAKKYKVRVILTNGTHKVHLVNSLSEVGDIAKKYYEDYQIFEFENTKINKKERLR